MKWFAFALALCPAAGAAATAQLKQVQSVYILPMSAGLDQYLANKIAREGVFQVVTDPQRADAILTDRIGEPFERKLDELYPAPPKPKAEKSAGTMAGDAKEGDGKTGDAKGGDAKAGDTKPGAESAPTDEASKSQTDTASTMEHTSSFSRGKGTIFLVDRRSRAIIWSTYDRPSNMRADTLDKTAEQIVRRLKHDLNPKPAAQ